MALGLNAGASMNRYRHSFLWVAAAAAAMAAGCANTSRSRELGNPQLSAATVAAQVCSNCHGLGGQSTSPNFPNLAAQPAAYVAAQLRGFRGQSRQDPAGFEYMWGLSRHLSDEQVDGLAAYYAAQSAMALPAVGPAETIAEGRTLYEAGIADRSVPACSTCHGQHGEGMAAFPRLAGQHQDYVMKQLLVFQRTDLRPEGSVMKTVAHGLTPTDIAAVAAYVQTMPGR
jgi:cytochrome c553